MLEPPHEGGTSLRTLAQDSASSPISVTPVGLSRASCQAFLLNRISSNRPYSSRTSEQRNPHLNLTGQGYCHVTWSLIVLAMLTVKTRGPAGTAAKRI
jgi:hypothetical protein